mgnify:CR=1 FL=1
MVISDITQSVLQYAYLGSGSSKGKSKGLKGIFAGKKEPKKDRDSKKEKDSKREGGGSSRASSIDTVDSPKSSSASP